ncbi:hypothetical protein Scep_029710 [Stephania cephalantha]|uniref:Uncharacterized protein n=1 Tax=Stephania cephalantha TaxID=152367 RepID=A0AAP0DY74_9MAGN
MIAAKASMRVGDVAATAAATRLATVSTEAELSICHITTGALLSENEQQGAEDPRGQDLTDGSIGRAALHVATFLDFSRYTWSHTGHDLFLDKNKDYVIAEHQALLSAASCSFVSGLFPPLLEESSKSSKFSSIGSRFKGVMEAIRINCLGILQGKHSEFLDRFSLLALDVLDGRLEQELLPLSKAIVDERIGNGEVSNKRVEVCEICGDYSHSAHDCPYYPQYENYHYSSYASPQPDFFGLMSNPQIPQHEGNQQFHQSTSLEDMMKQLIDNQQQFQRLFEELRQIDFEIPGLKDMETQFIQYNVRL